jgi:hypothetical protein
MRPATIAVAVLIGASGLCAGGWMISGSWVSPFEKRAIRAALTQIDEIRQYHDVDSDAYRAQIGRAKAAVATCKRREITNFDGQIVEGVDMYLGSAMLEAKVWRLSDSDPRKQRMIDVEQKADRSMEDRIRSKIE